MRTIPLPRAIAAKVAIREVEIGDFQLDPFGDDADARPVQVPFSFHMRQKAGTSEAALEVTVRVNGHVMLSRAEIAAAANRPYADLNQRQIGKFGLEVAVAKLGPAAAEMVAKVENVKQGP
jgi:hypothetical protein